MDGVGSLVVSVGLYGFHGRSLASFLPVKQTQPLIPLFRYCDAA